MQCKANNKDGKRCNRIAKDGCCWQHQKAKPKVKTPKVKTPKGVSKNRKTKVTIYTLSSCPYCIKTKQLLEDNLMPYTEIDVNKINKQQLFKKTGMKTVPQIFINNKLIGGYDQLYKIYGNVKTLNWIDWEDNAKKYALTINDILKLNPGEQIKLLPFHMNLWSTALDDKNALISLKPQKFFEHEWIIYQHNKGLKGKWFGAWLAKNEGVSKTARKIPPNKLKDFEFDVQYTEGGLWVPLKNGYLDMDGIKKQHWSKLPKTTKIGWRGPMIKWSDLKKVPNIIYNETNPKYISNLKHNLKILNK